ncbi:MAG: hypothetical protein A4E65_02181 [Syntrophorhabdus sp. PtaU1.Bin153]|nr:MAG: hypothetical protein A4E65_02181 [Syntrophorhabdus sp. PtaU1.Bin153]
MAKRSLAINLSLACVGAVLLCGSLSHASDGPADAGAQPRNEILRAFTRELAFIRTFAVEAPAQYEQKEQGMGFAILRSEGGRISEEEIKPREYRSDGAVKTKDIPGGKPGKKTKGRKK